MTERQQDYDVPHKDGHWGIIRRGDRKLLLVCVGDGNDGTVDVIATTSKASDVDVSTFKHIAHTMNRASAMADRPSHVAMAEEICRLRGMVTYLKDAIRSATAECDCEGVGSRLVEALAETKE